MRSFRQLDRTLAATPATVVRSLRTIDIGAGTEELHRHQAPELLLGLAHRARVESITASSAIEGVVVSDAGRARRIIDGAPLVLRSRSEQQLAGYRKALDYVYADTWRPLNVGLLLHLHRLLWSETEQTGGVLKQADNLVVDRSPDGSTAVRFRPVPAAETENHLVGLVDSYTQAVAGGQHHPVLLVGLFALDFLVIHPFEDGNGRVARVLSNALLSDVGYQVGQWISVEQLIAETADEYYAALKRSTDGWFDDTCDVWPWLDYFCGILATGYTRFAVQAASANGRTSKQEQVRRYVLERSPSVFRVSDLRAALPGVSSPTIRLVLAELRTAGAVEAQSTGRSATWRRLQR